MIFGDWDSLIRLLVFGTTAYLCAIVMLRLSGSRTLAKMHAYDLVVTIAFGSVLASIMLDSSVSLSTGIAALALLVVLQYLVAKLAVRYPAWGRLVTSHPVLLAWQGRELGAAMLKQRVTSDDLRSALRQHGYANLDQVGAVVIEADGTLSIIDRIHVHQPEQMGNVQMPPDGPMPPS
ncbi:DUF421 domain-containing protein [Massilia scottii]|uniref:DUF421 domain-containing protein n=1 Tax=Massilia scottii TaxID=3057166 RepID=UPI0027964F1E|nr:YetF domain-containing protein [Massilia sp. CCM 9029]MDQ1833726.1 DUF421 domain-containing protein [Massilia sp. CCM 9029]